jgi:hypothetical protein
MVQAAILLAPLFQQDDGGAAALFGSVFVWCCVMIFAILMIAGMWKVFVKANKPGWAAIIPFYNIYIMLEIIGRPSWWLILYFIPVVNVVVGWLVLLELASSFGKGMGFGIGMILLPFVFILLLGFGDAQYVGPKPVF